MLSSVRPPDQSHPLGYGRERFFWSLLAALGIFLGGGVPGLDIPGIDIVSLARGYGCHAARADTLDVLRSEAAAAADRPAPTVLEIPIAATVPPLL